MTANGGDSRGSNQAERHHRRVAEALEVLPRTGRDWSYGDNSRGSPTSSSSGTAARGLPGRAMTSYAIVGCVGVVDDARGGWGQLHL